jgi:hypothetical protein
MAAEPFSAAALAINAATPFVSRALGSLFGVKSAEEEERARIEAAMAPFQRVAEGGTTQGQAGLAYARGRALSDLAAMAQRGTAQQQAGLQREAMRQGVDVQAQYASQLAELRAREQERARQAVSEGQMALAKVAREDAKRKREELAGFIGGTLGMATKAFVPGGGATGPAAGGKPTLRMGGAETNVAGQTLADAAAIAGGAAGAGREPVTAVASPGKATGAQVASELGLDIAQPVMSTRSYQQRNPGMPGVTAREAALNPSAIMERLRQERNLAFQPEAAARGIEEGRFSKAVAAPAAEGPDTFASLADRAAVQKELAPVMLPVAQQGAPAPMVPTVEPMAFSYQGEQAETLRKQRPGRMPRRPAMKKTPGGGGFAL